MRKILVLFFIGCFLPGFTQVEQDDSTHLEVVSEQVLEIGEVSEIPEFPGGISAFHKFIVENFQRPKQKASGKIFLKFVISKTGEVSYVEVLRGIHPLYDKEARRVLFESPKWEPGLNYKGEPVSVFFAIPIVIP